MRYCRSCRRLSPGEPRFCSTCGKSYNLKFCPRMHPNPRGAQFCRRCGSRDLTTPQPKPAPGTGFLRFMIYFAAGLVLVSIGLQLIAILLGSTTQIY